MNMKATMIIAMIAGVAIADTPVLPLTIDFRARTCPGLEVYSANQRVLDVTIKDGFTKYDYTGRTPVMWWSPSNNQTNLSGVVMAAISNTNPTNGTFRATWSPSNLNTNGNFWYGVGITTNGVVTTARIGQMRIIYDPYASGVSPVSFGKSLNWGTITQYLGTATYGPYRAGSGISASANADGSVTFAYTGSVASASWGAITGSISNQTDLISLLAGKSDTNHNHDALYYPLASNPSNYCTLAAAAMLTNGLASTGYVAGVVAGYVATNNSTYTDTVAKAASALQVEADTINAVLSRGNMVTNLVANCLKIGPLIEYLGSRPIAFANPTNFEGAVGSYTYLFTENGQDGFCRFPVWGDGEAGAGGSYKLYDSGNFLAGTHYLAPGSVTLASLGGVTNTAAGIAAAGGVTNAINDPVLSVYNLSGLSVDGTCTITRAWGNAFRIAPTATVYFAADATMTDTNTEAGFTLDLFYNAQTFGFVTASITNTATLVSNAWNNIIFWKGYGSSVFIGR